MQTIWIGWENKWAALFSFVLFLFLVMNISFNTVEFVKPNSCLTQKKNVHSSELEYIHYTQRIINNLDGKKTTNWIFAGEYLKGSNMKSRFGILSSL